MGKHTIKAARYMWNYVIELTFDNGRKAAFDFERVVKGAVNAPAIAKYQAIPTFRDNATIGNPNQLAWADDMVFDANWLYALMPDADQMTADDSPLTIIVNCKF